MKQKITAVFLLVTMFVLLSSNIGFAFNDTNGHWAEEYANKLYEKGIFNGDENGNANLGLNIKRSEFITLLIRGLYPDTQHLGYNPFKDVQNDDWFYSYVGVAVQEGIVSGDGSGFFYPDQLIKREEIVLMLSRALNLNGGNSLFTDVPRTYPYYGQISAVSQKGYINGYSDGSFGPQLPATKAEAVTIISRVLIDKGIITPTATPVPTPSPTFNPNAVGKVNLTWQQTYNTGITTTGDFMPGVGAVSPMWFKIVDSSTDYPLQGGIGYYIEDIGNPEYIQDIRSKGYEIWPMFKTDFGAEKTSVFLNNAAARASAVETIRALISKYGLDGINLDFENMYQSDKNAYSTFVKEVADMCREMGATSSVDVTKYDATSSTWSLCYDRTELAKHVDYVALMAYDENGTWSRTAGPVSSIPWVENAIQITLEEVPAEKLLLGVPFYTRLWEEENGVVVKTSAIGMDTAQARIAEAGAQVTYDAEQGLNYATWTEGNRVMKIWLEDETSMQARIDLIHKYNLAGIASWSMKFESADMWPFIAERLGS